MKLKKLLMIPIVGLLLLGSAHTILAAESVDAQIPVAVEVHIPQNVTTSETPTVILKPESGAPMPSGAKDQATLTFSTAGGKMTFPAITFTEPGDYNYTLEQAPAADPAHYWADNKKYSVRVKVFVNEEEGDHNGELYVVYSAVDATGKETAVSGEDGKQSEFVFVNSVYEPCIIDPPVLKKVVDANGNVVEDTVGTFVFRMEAIGNNAATAPMPDNKVGGSKDLTLTGSTKYLREGDFGPLYEDSKGTLTEFGVMKYFETGTWEYQISEVNASTGYTVDDEIYNLKMEITRDDTNHKYVATRTVTTKKQGVIELAEFSFTNKMIPETTPETTPTGGGGNGPGGGGRRSRPETSNPPSTPETPGEVLGATRDVGRGVLGAVRNPQVLGAVRTGDSSAMVTWAVILMLAASGIVGWFNMYHRRKRNV
jgi:hypothetical protein